MLQFLVRPLHAALLVAALLPPPAAAQRPARPIPGMAGYRLPTMSEMLVEQVRDLGSALDTRSQLAQQRGEQIRILTERLAACGSCAERGELQEALARWQETDRLVREAERGALAAMGLGQYRDIGELQVGLAQALGEASRQLEAQKQRERELGLISGMVVDACRRKHEVQRPAHCAGTPLGSEAQRRRNAAINTCIQENDVLRLYANEQTRVQLCSRLPGHDQCGPDKGILAQARAYERERSREEMQARDERRDERLADQERLRQQGHERREQRREERQRQREMSAAERREAVNQRNAERQQQALDRQAQRRECENG
ncbi:MAG: hypothetical protein JNN18_22745 [Rubrivivax sp.]|nr:hypothetical protein [Rubrivivax sp.]